MAVVIQQIASMKRKTSKEASRYFSGWTSSMPSSAACRFCRMIWKVAGPCDILSLTSSMPLDCFFPSPTTAAWISGPGVGPDVCSWTSLGEAMSVDRSSYFR